MGLVSFFLAKVGRGFTVAIFTYPIIENRKEVRIMYTRSEEHDMICKIHRMEDKLLRSKNPAEQEQIQGVLRGWRMQLQKLQFKNLERGR